MTTGRSLGGDGDLDPRSGRGRFDRHPAAERDDAVAQAGRSDVAAHQLVVIEAPSSGNPRPSSRTTIDSAVARGDVDGHLRGMPCLSALTTASCAISRAPCSVAAGSDSSGGVTRTTIGTFHSTARRADISSSRCASDPASAGGRRRPQILDEQPQLALLERERALDRQQPILDRQLAHRLRGNRLQLEADAGQRLQHAVVEITRQANPILANRQLPQPIGEIQLIERVADLARHHVHDRHRVAGRAFDAGEANAAGEKFGTKGGRRMRRRADAARKFLRQRLVERRQIDR